MITETEILLLFYLSLKISFILYISDLSTLDNSNFRSWFSWLWSYFVEIINYVLTLNNFTKYDVFSIKPWAFNKCNEKLWSVSIFSCISHWQKIWLIVFNFKILIFKFISINWLSSSSIVISKISALRHKIGNNPMEMWIFKSESFWVSTKLSKILCSFRSSIIKKFEDNFSSFVSSEVNIKEYFRFWHIKIS